MEMHGGLFVPHYFPRWLCISVWPDSVECSTHISDHRTVPMCPVSPNDRSTRKKSK